MRKGDININAYAEICEREEEELETLALDAGLAYRNAVARHTEGLTGLTVWQAPEECEECMLALQHGRIHGFKQSASPCQMCGTVEPGWRHAAHAYDRDGEQIHLSICRDCVEYLLSGREPERWEERVWAAEMAEDEDITRESEWTGESYDAIARERYGAEE